PADKAPCRRATGAWRRRGFAGCQLHLPGARAGDMRRHPPRTARAPPMIGLRLRFGRGEVSMSVGPWQIVIIALVILLLFGAGRLADIGKGLGEGIRNFKKGISEDPDASDDEPKQLVGKELSDKQEARKKQSK